MLTGLSASLVLLASPKPIIAAVMPATVPVKVGEAILALRLRLVILALRSKADCVAVEIGFSKSVVLSTLEILALVTVIFPASFCIAVRMLSLEVIVVKVRLGLIV